MIEISEKKLSRQIRMLVLLIFILFASGTIGYALIKKVSALDAFILTIETLTFKYGAPQSIEEKVLQVSLLLFGTVVLWFVLWKIFDIALEGKFQEHFGKVKIMKKIAKLKDHYIICGAGRVGMRVAEELKKRGKKFVIAEKDPNLSESLREKGYLVVDGTSTDENTLLRAGIKEAKYLIAATGDDSKNILIILTAKELNPNIKVGSRASNEAMVPKLKHAGADYIVLPEVIGGIQLVEEMLE